jgi:cytosine/creatinine deaminase
VRTPFFDELRKQVSQLGGFHNAHLHLCRAGTIEDTKKALELATESHLSIAAKHGLIPLIHGSDGFKGNRFAERMDYYLRLMIESGTMRADTLVDVASETLGRSTFDKFLEIKVEYSSKIDIQLGAYCPLGFRDDTPNLWNLIEETAPSADFIGSLPERDDQRMYPDHIGFRDSIRRILDLSNRTNKSVHIHVDQKNDPAEDALEIVLDEMEIMCTPWQNEPQVWFVHAISPSAYEETRFNEMVARMGAAKVGVICCPSAAISMRQIREVNAPTHNSIARVLDFLAADIPIRVASDNINDITSPAGTADLMDELFVLCNAIRFYDIPILARLGAGKPLTTEQRDQIRTHLELDAKERHASMMFTRS